MAKRSSDEKTSSRVLLQQGNIFRWLIIVQAIPLDCWWRRGSAAPRETWQGGYNGGQVWLRKSLPDSSICY